MDKKPFIRKILVPAGLSCLMLLVVLAIHLVREGQSVERIPAGGREPSRQIVKVHLSGEVLRPGMVEVEKGSTLMDCIEACGGLTERADPGINLAYPVESHMTVVIHARGKTVVEGIGQGMVVRDGRIIGGTVNINTAGMDLLCLIPGVGEATAGNIIRHREEHGDFETIEDIMQVPGIKEGRFSGMKEWISAR
ncbi:MAG: helix-hairpin-helix domain-containing protein [Clostridia bacterium]